jgi:hypothetical protein
MQIFTDFLEGHPAGRAQQSRSVSSVRSASSVYDCCAWEDDGNTRLSLELLLGNLQHERGGISVITKKSMSRNFVLEVCERQWYYIENSRKKKFLFKNKALWCCM